MYVLEWDLRVEFELTTHSHLCTGGSRDICYVMDKSSLGRCYPISFAGVERKEQADKRAKQSAEPALAAVAALAKHTRLKAKPKPKTTLCVCASVRTGGDYGLDGLPSCMAAFPKAAAIDDRLKISFST